MRTAECPLSDNAASLALPSILRIEWGIISVDECIRMQRAREAKMTWAEELKGKGVIERVDSFLRRFQDLDFVSRPIHESDKELAHSLAKYLSDYIALDVHNPCKEGLASLCEVWINRAIAAGIIKEGEGVFRQLRRTNEERAKLIEENQKLARDLAETKAELELTRSRLVSPHIQS